MGNIFKRSNVFSIILFVFVGLLYLPIKMTGHSNKDDKSNSAQITIDVYTSDDSTKVLDYFAYLKDSNNNIIKTAYPDSNRVVFTDVATPVENLQNTIPSNFKLYQNYPNPFNPSTKIQFDVSRQASVKLDVYDILGKHVKTLVNGELNPGKYEATWAADNDNGETVAQGVYIYRLIAGDKSVSKKMIDLGSAKGTSSFRQLGQSNINNLTKSQSTRNSSATYYTINIVNTDSTSPNIITKSIPIDLLGDTTFNAYVDKGPNLNITIDAFTSDDSSKVIKYIATVISGLDNYSIIATAYPDSNRVILNVPIKIDFDIAGYYGLEIASTDSTNPKIVAQGYEIKKDTAFSVYLDRKPITITANVSTDNGSTPVTGYTAILKDTLDNVIERITAAGSQAAFHNEPANKFYRMQIQNTSSTNPFIKDTVFQVKAISDTLFNINAERHAATRTISGILTDDEGNVKSGYVLAYNANGDSAVAMAGIDGKFSITTALFADILKAQIYNPSHAEGFIRKIYVSGGNDTSNVTIDAVPLLADSAYIAPDILASFAWEANFEPQSNGMYYEGLKKADFNNVRHLIASVAWTGDTIKTDEQKYIKKIIEQKIDFYFKKPSSIWLVPQDSSINYNGNGITWVKNKHGAVGSIGCWDNNNDGIMDGAGINLMWIIEVYGQDTVYNDRAIVQEGLSGYVAPGEVGFTSTISGSQTVLHINTDVKTLQPADIWLVHIAEEYAPKTSFFDLLTIDNLKVVYDRLKK